MLRQWPKRATTDQGQIHEWWEKWPAANVAVVTGDRSRLLVLDVDPDSGGEESLADLERQHGALPATLIGHTGGGGRHLLFRYPDVEFKLGNSQGAVGQGLDVRGEGGMILVEPSRHPSGETYRWNLRLDLKMLVAPPTWFLDLIRATSKPIRRGRQGSTPAILREGQRNTQLTRLAGRCRLLGLSEAALSAALSAENGARCSPPLPQREVEAILRQAKKWSDSPPWLAEPMRFVWDPRLNSTDRIVLLVLSWHAGADGIAFPGVERIAEIAGVVPNTVFEATSRLEAAKRISVSRSRRGNNYQLLSWEPGEERRAPPLQGRVVVHSQPPRKRNDGWRAR